MDGTALQRDASWDHRPAEGGLTQEVEVLALGDNSSGQAGVGVSAERILSPAKLSAVSRWKLIACGGCHAAGVSDGGDCFLWGEFGTAEPQRAPVRVSSLDGSGATEVACGWEHTVVITDRGVVAWGGNHAGQCAVDAEKEHFLSQPRLVRIPGLTVAVQLACGSQHTLLLSSSGTVFVWGGNSYGQLGLGDARPELLASPETPMGLWGVPVNQVVAGSSHSLVLAATGGVYVCGRAKEGQLGLRHQGTVRGTIDSPIKRRASSFTASARLVANLVSMGFAKEQAEHALIETRNQSVEAALEYLLTPQEEAMQADPDPAEQEGVLPPGSVVTIQGLVGRGELNGSEAKVMAYLGGKQRYEVRVISGERLALRPRNIVAAIQKPDMLSPTAVQVANVRSFRKVPGLASVRLLAAGASHSVACTGDAVLSWGAGSSGQLGHGGLDNEPLPRVVAGIANACDLVSLSCGSEHSLWCYADGLVVGCGAMVHGQLGDPEDSDQLEPIDGKVLVPRPLNTGNCKPRSVVAAGHSTFLAGFGQQAWAPAEAIRASLEEMIVSAKSSSVASTINLTKQVFSSGTLVAGVFQSSNAEEAATQALFAEKVFKSILQAGMQDADAVTALFESLQTLTAEVESHIAQLNDQLRLVPLLTILQAPLLSQPSFATMLIPPVARILARLPEAGRGIMVQLLANLPKEILGSRVSFITAEMERYGKAFLGRSMVLPALSLIYSANTVNRTLPATEFYNDLISSRAFEDRLHAIQEYLHWQESLQQGGQSLCFCSFPFLLSNAAKSNLLHAEAELRMSQRIQQSRMEHLLSQTGMPIQVSDNPIRDLVGASSPRRKANVSTETSGPAYPSPEDSGVPASHPDMCIIRVRRSHLLEDALDEIIRQQQRDLYKPLKVHFIGEEGIDAGGLKKEFFQLLVHELAQPDYAMLSYQDESRTYWFNPSSFESAAEFTLLGLIFGIAIYNSVILDVHFPIVLYKKLLGQIVGLSDLAMMQPQLGKSFEELLTWEGPGSVADVFCATFTIDSQAFGEVNTAELLPGGRDIQVTEENRHDYVQRHVDYVLNVSIRDQFDAFAHGFMLLAHGPALSLFSPEELEALVCGQPDLDLQKLQQRVAFEGYSADSTVVTWLWEVLTEFSLEQKRKFLRFFSGSDRAPIGGLAELTMKIQRAGPDSDRLPTSHTCFDLLLLPAYDSKHKLRTLLTTAVENAEGFGLQ